MVQVTFYQKHIEDIYQKYCSQWVHGSVSPGSADHGQHLRHVRDAQTPRQDLHQPDLQTV